MKAPECCRGIICASVLPQPTLPNLPPTPSRWRWRWLQFALVHSWVSCPSGIRQSELGCRQRGRFSTGKANFHEKKKKKVLHCKSTENTWKVENTSEGNSLKRITMSNSGSDPTSALSVPSYGAPAGLCTSMEPPTSRNSSWFPLVSWAE